MRISLQQIRDNKISLLQFSAKEDAVTSNFAELCRAITNNTSIKTIISHHLDDEKFLQLTDICNLRGISYLNLVEHIVSFQGVHKPSVSHSPKPPVISTHQLFDIARSTDSAEFDIEPESVLDAAVLANNNLLLVQYAARPLTNTFEQVYRMQDGMNVKIWIIDLTNKRILGADNFSIYRGMEICPGDSNHVAILTENKILIMDATIRFTQVNKFNLAAQSVKFLPDGNIIAIPVNKKTSSYFLIDSSSGEISPVDKTQFHEVNSETNQTEPLRGSLHIEKMVVLSSQKFMAVNRNAAQMLTFKDNIKTRERFITDADNHCQLALDATTVAVGSGAGIKIWDSTNHFHCTAANRFECNTTFSKLLYFANQKLLASVFSTCMYFWEIRGKELTLKGVFPIPKNCKVAVTADCKLLVADCRQGKLKLNKFDIVPLQHVLSFQEAEESRVNSAPRLPFFSPQGGGFGRAQLAPAAYQADAPSIFANPLQALQP